jgi:hypothetical protein
VGIENSDGEAVAGDSVGEAVVVKNEVVASASALTVGAADDRERRVANSSGLRGRYGDVGFGGGRDFFGASVNFNGFRLLGSPVIPQTEFRPIVLQLCRWAPSKIQRFAA